MKNIPNPIKMFSFINLLIGIGLFIAGFRIAGVPIFPLPILLFFVFLIPKPWARSMGMGICALITFLSLLWIFINVAIGETLPVILLNAVAGLSSAIVYFSTLAYLFTDKARRYYIKTIFISSKDDLGPQGWICPQCNAKNRFSERCWNCDFSKEEYLKATSKPAGKESIPKKSEQIESKKNKEEKELNENEEVSSDDKKNDDKIEKYKEKKKKENVTKESENE